MKCLYCEKKRLDRKRAKTCGAPRCVFLNKKENWKKFYKKNKASISKKTSDLYKKGKEDYEKSCQWLSS